MTTKKISPQEYRKIIDGTEFLEIYTESCSAKVDRDKMLEVDSWSISVDESASYKQEENIAIVRHTYNLSVVEGENEEPKILKIRLVFVLRFATTEPFNKMFFEVFKDINLPMNSWPFFREAVYSMTAKMNIPPLILPFKKRL